MGILLAQRHWRFLRIGGDGKNPLYSHLPPCTLLYTYGNEKRDDARRVAIRKEDMIQYVLQ